MILLRIDGSRMVLETAATPAVLALLPRLEGRRHWINRSSALSLEATDHNLTVLKEIHSLKIKYVEGEVVTDEAPPQKAFTTTYSSKTKPYEHQDRALVKMRGRAQFGLFMEQGTGKTKVILDRAGELHAAGKITGLLVVSKKGVHRQWIESEIPTHLGCEYAAAFWPQKELPGELRAMDARLKIFAINFDGLARVAIAKKIVLEFLMAHRGSAFIVADESQEIKNARSMRHKAMLAIAGYAPYRALATGTPIAKDLTDEWAQLKWLNEVILGIRYVTTFRSTYCIMGGFEGRMVVGHRNVEAFKARTEPFTFRATKNEIGILPKQYNKWVFDLLPEQRKMMASLKRELEAQLASGQIVSAANAVVALSKFQQVASGFLIDEKGRPHRLMKSEANPRIIALREWLEADETAGKAVIWHRFKEEAVMIEEALDAAEVSVAHYIGSDKARDEAKKSFLDPQGARVFLANPATAGTGLNLQGLCSRVIYFSNSFNSLERWQSEDRTHRIGTKGIVTYTDMIGKGSIDGYIMRNLMKKKGLSDWVLGDVQNMLEEVM